MGSARSLAIVPQDAAIDDEGMITSHLLMADIDADFAKAIEPVRRLGRVAEVLVLGVDE